MRNFISEDDIEQAILQKVQAEPFCYDIIHCDPSPDKRELLPDGTGRANKKQCVLPQVLRKALARLNPQIPQEKLAEIARDLCRDFSASDMTATNYKYCNYSVLKANCPWNIESSASKAAIPAFAAVEVKVFSSRKSIAPCSERNVPMTLLFILTIRRSRSA